MALDGIFLSKLKYEMCDNVNAHIDKIYQPTKNELVFLLRSKEGAKRLIISVAPGRTHINFTQSKPENPEKPPMFCMLLRKHLGAARVVGIEQHDFERVLTITFSASNEMGDIVYPKLVCELISSNPNIILCDQNGIIIDAIRHSDLENSSRIIHPGAVYKSPAVQGKLNILKESNDDIINSVLSKTNCSVSKALLNTLDGFSPLVANELSTRASIDIDKPTEQLNTTDKMNLIGQLNILKQQLNQFSSPFLITSENGEIKDFCFTEITHLGSKFKCRKAESFSEALDIFFSSKEKIYRIKKESEDILKLLVNLTNRTEKKLHIREKELLLCKDREKYRIYGELLKANSYRLTNGMKSCSLENYYDENLSLIEIPLNPALSPAANADYYFKEYKKCFSAERTLTELIKADKKDLLYFESVLDSLSRIEETDELKDIRAELKDMGFIKDKNERRKTKKQNDIFSKPKEFNYNSFKILVGKNNRQNDYLTLNFADKEDIWFHTKNIPGSHVIIITNGLTPDDETVYYAASLAAKFSKASASTNVAVDFTPVKFVKKPSGAKPGMVIYSKNRTLFVDPLKIDTI